MKTKRNLLFLIAMLLFSTMQVLANDPIETNDPSDGDGGDETTLTREKIKDPNGRPQAPSMQCIYCHYDGEELTFSFAFSEGECELMLTESNTGMTSFYTIDSSDLFTSVYVGTIGQTDITLTTARGVTYTGTINCSR